MWTIISGTGLEQLLLDKQSEKLETDTPFGHASSGLSLVDYHGNKVLFLPRHGENHELLPSEINYRANLFALKKYKATKILSLSTVGSLREDLKPGDVVIPNQYLNFTYINRHHTFCGNGLVGHVSLANPVTETLIDELIKLKNDLNFTIHFRHTYVCIEGPYYSTRAESLHWQKIGGDVIGMTNFPEYALAREAGICYLPCTFVTDYDCWNQHIKPVNFKKFLNTRSVNIPKALALIDLVAKHMLHLLPKGCPDISLKNNLLTNFDSLSVDKKQWLTTLLQ